MVSLPTASADPRKAEFYGALLERTVRGLLEALGESNLEAVLLIGAPARGEATVVDTPEGLYSLSDIDLVCVSKASADAAELLRQLSRSQADLNRELRTAAKGVDVSVRTAADLVSLPALITTYEMLRAPSVLWGDPGVLDSLPELRLEEIPPADALTLLHNRIVETLLLHGRLPAVGSDHRATATVLYGTAKLALDAVTALLYAERNVPLAYPERVEVFRNVILAEDAPLRGRLADYVDDLPFWARFKTRGDLDGVIEHLGGQDADRGAVARDVWRRYAHYAEVFWREILGRITGTDAGDTGLAETAALYAGLESVPQCVGRTWRLSRRGAAPDRLFSTWALFRGALFASPRQRAYLTAVLSYLGLAGATDLHTADDLIHRYSPFPAANRRQSIASDAGRERLLESLALFHQTLLLGRRPRRS